MKTSLYKGSWLGHSNLQFVSSFQHLFDIDQGSVYFYCHIRCCEVARFSQWENQPRRSYTPAASTFSKVRCSLIHSICDFLQLLMLYGLLLDNENSANAFFQEQLQLTTMCPTFHYVQTRNLKLGKLKVMNLMVMKISIHKQSIKLNFCTSDGDFSISDYVLFVALTAVVSLILEPRQKEMLETFSYVHILAMLRISMHGTKIHLSKVHLSF